jgi:alpha-amylase/alpha-mannosidase (GH57 family)
VVSVILDGENAWETYPCNGYEFLTTLYESLATHPELELTTFSDCLAQTKTPTALPGIVAGSWVYGNFSTWIGSPEKNRAWDLLCQAKLRVDAVLARSDGDQDRQLILRQLGVCEASDWFWWLADYHSEESVTSFESLFRHHLSNLYRLLGEDPPTRLGLPVAHGAAQGEPLGTMRRSS